MAPKIFGQRNWKGGVSSYGDEEVIAGTGLSWGRVVVVA